MEHTNKKQPSRRSLPVHIAGLCTNEDKSLSRPVGDGHVIERHLDPNEKIRTTGARTRG